MLVPCAAPYVRVLCSLCAPPLALPTPACAAYQVICERALVGSYLGPRADYAEMLEMARDHGVRPQVELAPVSQINAMLERVRAGKARGTASCCRWRCRDARESG